MLNIYRFYRKNADYEEVQGFVIAADDEAEARLIAKLHAMCEGKAIWDTVTCEHIGTTNSLPEGVVLTDFRGS